MLGSFLFRGDDVYKSLSVLSGGEKSRFALLRMLLKPMNLLILDEPTNHLDLNSKDILMDVLKAFAGTVIFVSHDRGFMEALSTKTFGLGSGRHCLYYGGYAYYLERIKNDDEVSLVSGSSPNFQNRENAEKENIDNEGSEKLLRPRNSSEYRTEEKQRQTLLRRLRREEENILGELERLETEKAELEIKLSRPDVYSSAEKSREIKRKLDEIAMVLAEKNTTWEAKAAELERAGL